jgi:hypothetical protein
MPDSTHSYPNSSICNEDSRLQEQLYVIIGQTDASLRTLIPDDKKDSPTWKFIPY